MIASKHVAFQEPAASATRHEQPQQQEQEQKTNPEMTTRYTDDEWASIIAQTERSVRVLETPRPCPSIDGPEFARTVDHTLLKIEATGKQIDALCAEARVAGFASVCVRPTYVAQAYADVKGSGVKVACVIGFPEGTQDLYYKMHETRHAIESGADELDVVLNWPLLRQRDYSSIYNELATLRAQAPHPALIKLILETSQLTQSEIVAACTIAAAANVDFVKTSTGFLGQGATVRNVRLMAACCDVLAVRGRKMLVKASGGIRTLEDAVSMLEAGASRLGTSGGVWIVKEAREMVERSRSPPMRDGGEGERPGLTTRLFTDY